MDATTIITIEMIITIIAVLGSALTVYLSMKRIGDNIRSETEWRTSIRIDLKHISTITTEIKTGQKDNTDKIIKLTEANVKQQGEIEFLKREIEALKRELQHVLKRLDRN